MGIILGCSGRIGSGKDTLAEYIIRNSSKPFQIKKFADNLKKVTAIISGKSIMDMYTSEGKNMYIPEFDMSVGTMQQKIGTEVFRDNFDQDVWVKSLFASYTPDQNWIITDVRFPNEADYIKNVGGYIFRIDGDPAKVRENSNRILDHPSETSLDRYKKFDQHILNHGSLEELEQIAKTIIEIYNL